MTNRHNIRIFRTLVLALALVLGTLATASAQGDQDTPLKEQVREQVREQIRECLETGAGAQLQEQTRERIRSCLVEDLDAGLPVDLVLAKLREGLRKNASDAALEQAVETMSGHVAFAAANSNALVAEGAFGSDRAVRTMAQSMWSGLTPDDVGQICEQARQRLRDGSCGLDDVAGAGEAALMLRHRGVDSNRAVRLVGEALRQGYDSERLLLMGAMAETAGDDPARVRNMVRTMENCLGAGMASNEMVRHMVQAGWLGQSGTHEFGGNGPTDPGHNGPEDPGQNGGNGGSDGNGTGSDGTGGTGTGGGDGGGGSNGGNSSGGGTGGGGGGGS